MPTLVWLYLTALLYYRTSSSCVALAEVLETVSHDRLTRMLQGHGSGQRRLAYALRPLFTWERGALMLDDTVVPQPFATAIAGLAWVYSSQEHRPAYGVSLVLLVWTHGTPRVPLGMRLWHKGGASKDALALELLSDARNRLRCRPDDVLFDAWSPAKALLKRIRDYRWSCVCRLQKNRRFNGQAVRQHRRPPYWAEMGWWNGGLNVLGVRDGKQDDATHRLSLSAAEGRRRSQLRSQIAEVSRGCKDQLGVTGCQARSERAPLQHFPGCVVACCVLERARQDRGLTIYKLKRQLSCHARTVALPALERLRQTA
jgi:DDE superfamily endonuclease